MDEQPTDSVVDEEIVQPKAAFFVTVSRHLGFGRLHKVGCCSLQPWTCYKVEYLARVAEGAADAVCKTCQRSAGKMVEDDGSSSSGSSSPTEVETNEPKRTSWRCQCATQSFRLDPERCTLREKSESSVCSKVHELMNASQVKFSCIQFSIS